MRKRVPNHRATANTFKIPKTAPRTGDHCPSNGWWAPADNPTDGQFISEGNLMPSEKGGSVSWTLLPGQMATMKEPKYDHPKPGSEDS
ncbi:MAG: hypothetical protein NVS2B15_19370 [Pseudarthrobacter sp.]